MQHDLFGTDSHSIKEHHLKRLRALRDEFAQRARDNERKARLLDQARRQEDWAEIKRATTPLRYR